jgi:hypothetical protein
MRRQHPMQQSQGDATPRHAQAPVYPQSVPMCSHRRQPTPPHTHPTSDALSDSRVCRYRHVKPFSNDAAIVIVHPELRRWTRGSARSSGACTSRKVRRHASSFSASHASPSGLEGEGIYDRENCMTHMDCATPRDGERKYASARAGQHKLMARSRRSSIRAR